MARAPIVACVSGPARKLPACELHPNGLYYIAGEIDGVQCSFLIDTGATYTIIDRKVWENIPGRPVLQPATTALTVAGGGSLQVHGCFRGILNIAETGDGCSHLIIVAELGREGGILGVQQIAAMRANIDFDNRLIKLNGHVVPMSFGDDDYCTMVIATEHTTIPPMYAKWVSTHVDPVPADRVIPETRVLTPLKKWSLPTGCFTSQASLPPDVRNVKMHFSNVTDRQVVIHEGEILGIVSYGSRVGPLGQSGACNLVAPDSLEGNTELPEHLQCMLKGISTELSEQEKRSLCRLILEYKGIFMGPDVKLETTNMATHKIDTGDHPPIKIPPRRAGPKQREIIEKGTQEMLDKGVAQRSSSPWAFPVVIVQKKDGNYRFCIDYRELNKITKKDAYPLPRLDDALDGMANARFFSTLDLASGYWQVAMDEEDREKTAFATHEGLFEFTRMPFGLTNAPATFERLMERVLKGLTWDQCQVYLDDVMVYGATFEQALTNLRNVFERFRQAGLKCKPSKCELFQPEVAFLGHIVSHDGIRPDPAKTKCVDTWPIPRDVSDIRSFIGFCGYYRRFVRHFSTIAAPMVQLTKKEVDWNWMPQQQQAFEDLKVAMATTPVLAYPKADCPFILDTDASDFAVGAVLSQIQDGEEHPIAYGSHALHDAQLNYCTTYKELLAVVTFVKDFETYLFGQPIILRTDHAALQWLQNFKKPQGMLARWLSTLQQVNFVKIEHRPGKKHQNADSLSRIKVCGRKECLDHSAEPSEAPPVPPTEPVSSYLARLAAVTIESDEEENDFENLPNFKMLLPDEETPEKEVRPEIESDKIPPSGVVSADCEATLEEGLEQSKNVLMEPEKPAATKSETKKEPLRITLPRGLTRQPRTKPKRGRKRKRTVTDSPEPKTEKVTETLSPFTQGVIVSEAKEESHEVKLVESESRDKILPQLDGNADEVAEPKAVNAVQASETPLVRQASKPAWKRLDEYCNAYTLEQLAQWQDDDAEIEIMKTLLQQLESKPPLKDIASLSSNIKMLWQQWQYLEVKDGVLYRKPVTKLRRVAVPAQIVAPVLLQRQLFRMVHDHKTGGHLGATKTYKRIRNRFWWVGCKKDIHRWCQQCTMCQQVKKSTNRRKVPMTQYHMGFPLEKVATDLVGPLPTTKNGNDNILVISDPFTKYVEAYPIQGQTAQTVADRIVVDFICRFGCPRTLHSDQGPCYKSELMKEVCRLLEIQKTQTSPYRPQSDGQVERFNATMQQMLKSYVNENRDDWDDKLPYLMMAYRATVHESTGCTPNMLMFGRELALPVDLQYPPPDLPGDFPECSTEYGEWLKDVLREVHEYARTYLKRSAIRQKKYYDIGTEPHDLKIGDWVWYKDHVGAKTKLGKPYKGPYLVIDRPNSAEPTYTIQAAADKPALTVHIDNLKKSYGVKIRSWITSPQVSRGCDSAEASNQLDEGRPPDIDSLSASASTTDSELAVAGSSRLHTATDDEDDVPKMPENAEDESEEEVMADAWDYINVPAEVGPFRTRAGRTIKPVRHLIEE